MQVLKHLKFWNRKKSEEIDPAICPWCKRTRTRNNITNQWECPYCDFHYDPEEDEDYWEDEDDWDWEEDIPVGFML